MLIIFEDLPAQELRSICYRSDRTINLSCDQRTRSLAQQDSIDRMLIKIVKIFENLPAYRLRSILSRSTKAIT